MIAYNEVLQFHLPGNGIKQLLCKDIMELNTFGSIKQLPFDIP